MTNKSSITTQEVLLAAETYLAQTKTYEAVTLQYFADFLGVRVHIVYKRLLIPEWEQLQRMWIKKRLSETMEIVHTEVECQKDITLEDIAKRAGVPAIVACQFLFEDEQNLFHSMLPLKHKLQEKYSTIKHYVCLAQEYFAQAKSYDTVTLSHFADSLNMKIHILYSRFPCIEWETLRTQWILKRLTRAKDEICAEAKIQRDFTFKSIASRAGISEHIVRRYLSINDFQICRENLPRIQEKTVSEEEHSIREQYVHQAQMYLAQTKNYKEATLKHFLAYLGETTSTIHSSSSFDTQWEALRSQWIQNRVRTAFNEAYAEAKRQQDFTLTNIAKRAGIPVTTVCRYISKKEWKVQRQTLPTVILPFIQGKSSSYIEQLYLAMDTVYAKAKTREDFTMSSITKILGGPGILRSQHFRDEWRKRWLKLPTTKEKVLSALQTLVNNNTPIKDLTKQYIVEFADVNGHGMWEWFDEPYRNARHQLALRLTKEIVEPPLSDSIRIIPGGWIDIKEDVWDLRPAEKQLLRRDRLRSDIADIAWPLLQEDLRSPEVALGTVDTHYQGFIAISTVLGEEIPDVRSATLEAMQRVWMNYDGTQARRMFIRPKLVRIFTALMSLAERDHTINHMEMRSITAWLQNEITIGRLKSSENFLSGDELNTVIQSCLADINKGIMYTSTNPDLLSVRVYGGAAEENAISVIRWATALVILVMAFTGLRRESVIRLKTEDLAEIHTSLFVLAWRHNKKGEENIAILPAALAQEIKLYIHRTEDVRLSLKTEQIFLCNDYFGRWKVLSISQLSQRFSDFTKRYNIQRGNSLLTLNSTIFRRTYTTRALYEGRNIAALRAQLGHLHLDSTLRYAKFDLYEHPSEVGVPLDAYGRKALTLWHNPLMINELDPSERAMLLGAKVKHSQDVGLCRHSHCLKTAQGSPPPCSLCEHLVTGTEFLNAWEIEHLLRVKELEQLSAEPESEMLLAQMKYQFEHFEANFVFVQEKVVYEPR